MPSLRQRLKQVHLGEVNLAPNVSTTIVKQSWGTGWSCRQIARGILTDIFDFKNGKDDVTVGFSQDKVVVRSTAVANLESLMKRVDRIEESKDLPEKDFLTAIARLLSEKIVPVVVVNDRGVAFGIERKTVTMRYFELSSTIEGTSIFLLGCESAFTSFLEDAVNELYYESRIELKRARSSKTRLPTVNENLAIQILVEAMNRYAPNLADPTIQYAVAPAEVVSESKRDCSYPIDSFFLIDSQLFLSELGLAFSSFLHQHARIELQFEVTRVLCDAMEAVIIGNKELFRFEERWRKTVQSILRERADIEEEQSVPHWLARLSRDRLVDLAQRLSPEILVQAKKDWALPF